MSKVDSQCDTDYLIVGAGLAGLSCALKLSKRYPKAKIVIAELYNYTGGRVVTYHPPQMRGLAWENGAGRIPSAHKRIHSLLHNYGIPTLPLSKTQEWRPSGPARSEAQQDPWPVLASTIYKALQALPVKVLATHTIHELLVSLFGSSKANELELYFPYRSELKTLRADLALRTLITGSLSSEESYTVAAKGLSTLIQAIKKDLEQRGVKFLYGYRLVALSPEYQVPIGLKFEVKGEGPGYRSKVLTANKAILALHANALRAVNPFQNYPILKHLKMDPLLRIYGIYPTNHGKSWFSGLPRTVTDSPIRYFIPVNPAKGVAMVSYTEREDAKHWMSIENEFDVKKSIQKELQHLFPEVSIPNPLFFKQHPWTDGCSYWTPGLYSPEEESKKILRPFPTRWPTLYICGESFSLCQTWMEGALEHAEILCKTYFDC